MLESSSSDMIPAKVCQDAHRSDSQHAQVNREERAGHQGGGTIFVLLLLDGRIAAEDVLNAHHIFLGDIHQDALVLAEMTRARRVIPDKSSDLSVVDSALPLMKLHRAIFLAQPIEEQLEPSEADLLTFGITAADLRQTAVDLGCIHLGDPNGSSQPDICVVVGAKKRILVIRNIQFRRVTRSVTFILDTGAPVSYVCKDTLSAFGFDMASQSSNHIKAEVQGGVALDLYFLSPEGDKWDLNVLGMDYLQRVNAILKFNGRTDRVVLSSS